MIENDKHHPDSLEPPPLASESMAIKVGLVGGLLPLTAAIAGLLAGSEQTHTAIDATRVILSVLGMIVAGSAITLRYRSAAVWFVAAGCCLIARFGFPNSWDSFRLVAAAFCGVATLGGILVLLPFRYRMATGAGLALFHFGGIFLAVTSPPHAPVLTNYLWAVIYRPYLQFAYLNNAYQFYSPDPGPASELWFCLYYGTHPEDPVKMEILKQGPNGEPIRDTSGQLIYELMVDSAGELAGEPIFDAAGKYIFQEKRDSQGNLLKKPVYLDVDEQTQPDYLRTVRWLKLPKRERDFKDPLGQTYYRRLSLTEQVVAQNESVTPNVVAELNRRRQTVIEKYPPDPKEGLTGQLQIPRPDIVEFIFPAYVKHIAAQPQYKIPDRPIESIRVYRVTHKIIPPDILVGDPDSESNKYGTDLNDPTTYLPFYMGQYDAAGELMDPADPMLYWLVPIRKSPGTNVEDFKPRPRGQQMTLSEYKRLYEDFVYKHAGSHHMEGELKK